MEPATHEPSLPADLDARIGQLIMTGFRGLTPLDAEGTLRQIRDGHIGAVLLYDSEENTGLPRNIQSPGQTQALVAELHAASDMRGIPLLVTVDEEGGFYTRLKAQYGFPGVPTARDLGQRGDVQATHDAGAVTAHTLAEMGIDMNLAPVVDLHNPANLGVGFRGRAFSSDPEEVAAHGGAFVEAHHERGRLTTLKHFPGSGNVVFDPVSVSETAATWTPAELIPFRRLLERGIVDSILVSRARIPALDPELPAMLSPRIVNELLRGEMGFDGVIISDAVELSSIWEVYGFERALVLAINAGVDMLMFCNVPLGNVPYDGNRAERAVEVVAGAVARGEIASSRIDEACRRILRLKSRLQAR